MPIFHKFILFFRVLMKVSNIAWLNIFIVSVKNTFLACQKQLFSEPSRIVSFSFKWE